MDKVTQALLNIPVAINCYYGDPTLQWQDTIGKVRALSKANHVGPVCIITKGAIVPQRAKELADAKLPGLMVMVSISELPEGFEGIGNAHRYQNFKTLREAGIKCFAAVRPMMPPYNTTPEAINRIFTKLSEAGCETACVSGFRGNDQLIDATSPDKAVEWVLRVKQMTGFDWVLKEAEHKGIRLFTRVSCAVSYLTKRSGTYNPYLGSPQLVRCKEIGCTMIDTCGPVEPDQDVMNWLKDIGYELEWQPAERALCAFSSDNRLNCKSCCTTCFVQRQPRVIVHNARTLGDLTFCRFMLGGTLCTKPGMVDGGDIDVGQAKIVQEQVGRPIHCINTWWVWANQLDKCFNCRYCISTLYPNKKPVGCVPVEILNLMNQKR
jgi:hypothetical protein